MAAPRLLLKTDLAGLQPLLLVAVLAVTWLRFQREPARAAA